MMYHFRVRIRRNLSRLIGWFFGILWALLGASALPTPFDRAANAVAGVVALLFLARLLRYQPQNTSTKPLFRSPGYLIAVSTEFAAIFAVSHFLMRIGEQQEIPSAVGCIVGLHFIGLWYSTRSRRFLEITFGMCFVSTLSMILPTAWHTIDLRSFLLGTGNAAVLWLATSSTE